MPHGYAKLFAEEIDLLDRKDLVSLETEVLSLDWSGPEEQEVRVRMNVTRGHETKEQVVTAKHVILTVPLGVLKKKMGTLFKPGLPEEKVKKKV